MKSNLLLSSCYCIFSSFFWIFVSIFILFWGFGLISFGFLNSLAPFLLSNPVCFWILHLLFGFLVLLSLFGLFRGPFLWFCSWTFSIFFSPTATHNRFFSRAAFFRGTLKIQGLKLKFDLTEMSSVSFWIFICTFFTLPQLREEGGGGVYP